MPTTQSLRAGAPLVAPGGTVNLSASVSGSTVTLNWQAPGSGDPATSYLIEAGSSSGLSDIASFNTGSTATSFIATGVPAGRYFVRVRALNSAGIGPASNEVIVIVGAAPCAVAPGTPAGLAANVVGSTVTLTWTPPAGACPATSYIIEAGSATGLANLATLSTTASTFTTTGVPSGTYFVRVRAVNAAGGSGPSNEVVVTVVTPGGPTSDLINCARISSDATNLDHTLYIDSYPGSSMREVDLFFTSKEAVGSYAAKLTVLVNGSSIASASAGIGVGALSQSVLASFIFSTPLSIAPGSHVRLIGSQTAGPGELKFEGESLSNCPVTVAADSVSTTQAGPRMPIRIVGAP